DTAYASCDCTLASSHCLNAECPGASSRNAYTRTLTSTSRIAAVHQVEQARGVVQIHARKKALALEGGQWCARLATGADARQRVERLQAAAQHIRLGRPKPTGQPFEPSSIGRVEIDLDRLRNATDRAVRIMTSLHDLMIRCSPESVKARPLAPAPSSDAQLRTSARCDSVCGEPVSPKRRTFSADMV